MSYYSLSFIYIKDAVCCTNVPLLYDVSPLAGTAIRVLCSFSALFGYRKAFS